MYLPIYQSICRVNCVIYIPSLKSLELRILGIASPCILHGLAKLFIVIGLSSGHFDDSADNIYGFCQNICGCFFFKRCPMAGQIQHARLITHDDTIRFCSSIQPDMEGAATVCVRNGAYHRQTVDAVEQIVADHQRRTTSPLLYAKLLFCCGRIHPCDIVPIQQKSLYTVPAFKAVFIYPPCQSNSNFPISSICHVFPMSA